MKIAVIGGGQLGQMLGLAAVPLEITPVFVEPNPQCPAARAGRVLPLSYGASNLVETLAAQVELVTYEFENVPQETVEALEQELPVFPSSRSLATTQDRLLEKQLFASLNIPTAGYRDIANADDLARAAAELKVPLRVKTRRMGYDGRGQATIQDPEQADTVWRAIGAAPAIAEVLVPLARELSTICVRGRDGAMQFYPPVENLHQDGILRVSRAPAAVPDEERQRLEGFVRRIAESLQHVGVLTVEWFQSVDGALLANEIAPRVHNSGHWTVHGAVTSQFENHLRAGLGLALGDCRATGHSAMVNIIGRAPHVQELSALPGAHVHLYGKSARARRKLGHLVFVEDTPERIEAHIASAAQLLAIASESH